MFANLILQVRKNHLMKQRLMQTRNGILMRSPTTKTQSVNVVDSENYSDSA